MITLVPSTNNNNLIYDRQDVLTLIQLQHPNIDRYNIINKHNECHNQYILRVFALYDKSLCRETLYLLGICDTATHYVCVIHTATKYNMIMNELTYTKARLDRYSKSSSITYIRCIYPRINIIECGKAGIVPTSSPEGRLCAEAQARTRVGGEIMTQQRTHTQQHKKAYIICGCIVLCIISFVIGMYIAKATASPPVEHETKAYELIEDMHRQKSAIRSAPPT